MDKKNLLTNYLKIVDGKALPKFQIAKQKGILDKKIKKAFSILKSCELCERKCKVDRLKGKKGFCRIGKDWRIFGAHIHMGEEPELIPSATLFLAGCTMRCVYCQNAPDSITPGLGNIWSDKEVAKWIDKKHKEGCKNVNFVTPDCYVWNILKVLNKLKVNIPVVWNSSSYYSEKTAQLIKDIVDVYLLDFRYFNNKCAIKLSSAPNYPNVAKRNFLIANKNGELVVRVLVIPNHIECDAKPILKWIKNNLGQNIRINILKQYWPTWQANKFPEINRGLIFREYENVVSYAKKLGLNFIT